MQAVDIGATRLRRCFSDKYFVNYFNYSTEEIEAVNVTVELDPFLFYDSSGEAELKQTYW